MVKAKWEREEQVDEDGERFVQSKEATRRDDRTVSNPTENREENVARGSEDLWNAGSKNGEQKSRAHELQNIKVLQPAFSGRRSPLEGGAGKQANRVCG